MSGFAQLMEDKCMNFALRIINLCKFLNAEKHEYRIADQLFRSATSIGANFAEAQCAISKKDFVAKIYISLKESNETLYWLNLLHKAQYLSAMQYESIYADGEELKKILVKITKKAKSNGKEVQYDEPAGDGFSSFFVNEQFDEFLYE